MIYLIASSELIIGGSTISWLTRTWLLLFLGSQVDPCSMLIKYWRLYWFAIYWWCPCLNDLIIHMCLARSGLRYCG
jgi:hypothetical protein